MKKKFMIPFGILLILFSTVLFFSGVVWPWGWGAGLIFLIFGFFGDSSTPKNSPKEIKQSCKYQIKADLRKITEISNELMKLPEPWTTKSDFGKFIGKIQEMQNLSTLSITFKYGASLITSIKLSFTKSKESWMVTIIGEGDESIKFIETRIKDFFVE